MNEEQKTTHTLAEAEAALMREINATMTEIQLRQLELKRQEETFQKALDEAKSTARGALLAILRTNKLEGDWQPSNDFSTLQRVR